MVSNDEDLELFLVEFARLLRKYHYDISPYTLRKIITPNIILGGFSCHTGDGVLKPEYFEATEEAKKIIEDEDE